MQSQRNSFNGVAIAIGALATIGLIAILLSAAMQVSGWMFIGLIVGLVALAALVAWLIAFINQQRVKWVDASTRMQETQNKFTLALLNAGFKPDGCGGYEPIHVPQIAASKSVRSQVYDFNPNDIHTASVNYILYSIALLGDTGNRLASAPECAAATNLQNYSARSWERIVKHLSAAYDVVRQAGPIQNGGGVYVPASIGSVGQLYHHVLLNSAIEALPENKR